jgi:hypothetical protein
MHLTYFLGSIVRQVILLVLISVHVYIMFENAELEGACEAVSREKVTK